MEGNERRERTKDGASGRRKEREKERGRGKGRGKKGGGKAVGFLRGGGGGDDAKGGSSVGEEEEEGGGEGGEFRAAINAVELTPGWPFAGKVRLKERRNGRQLPPCKQAVEGGG